MLKKTAQKSAVAVLLRATGHVVVFCAWGSVFEEIISWVTAVLMWSVKVAYTKTYACLEYSQ